MNADRIILQPKCKIKDDCAICLLSLTTKLVSHLPCKHYFHYSCMQQVYANKIYTCPLCRYDLVPALLKTNFKYQYFNSYIDYASIFDYDRNTYVPFAYARSTYADEYARQNARPTYYAHQFARVPYTYPDDNPAEVAQADAPAGTQADAPAGTQADAPAGTQADAPAGTQADAPAGTQVDNNLTTWSGLLLNFILDMSGNNVLADEQGPAQEQGPADEQGPAEEQEPDIDDATELEILYYWYS